MTMSNNRILVGYLSVLLSLEGTSNLFHLLLLVLTQRDHWIPDTLCTRHKLFPYKQNLTKRYQIKFFGLRWHNITPCGAYIKGCRIIRKLENGIPVKKESSRKRFTSQQIVPHSKTWNIFLNANKSIKKNRLKLTFSAPSKFVINDAKRWDSSLPRSWDQTANDGKKISPDVFATFSDESNSVSISSSYA